MALEKAEAYLEQAGFADRIIKLEQSTATVDLAAAGNDRKDHVLLSGRAGNPDPDRRDGKD